MSTGHPTGHTPSRPTHRRTSIAPDTTTHNPRSEHRTGAPDTPDTLEHRTPSPPLRGGRGLPTPDPDHADHDLAGRESLPCQHDARDVDPVDLAGCGADIALTRPAAVGSDLQVRGGLRSRTQERCS